MKCPNCKAKLYVADTVQLPEGDEMYRLRYCKECGEIVYTTEYPVEKTKAFLDSWNANHRTRQVTPLTKTGSKYRRYTPTEMKFIKVNCYGSPTLVAAHLGRSKDSVRKYMYEFRKEKEAKKKVI